MLKILIVLKKSPSSGSSASRFQLAFGDWELCPQTPSPCDLTHTYCNATKSFKFDALLNEGFKEKILVKTVFGEHTIHLEIFCFEHSSRLSPLPNFFLSYVYDSATFPSKLFLEKIG